MIFLRGDPFPFASPGAVLFRTTGGGMGAGRSGDDAGGGTGAKGVAGTAVSPALLAATAALAMSCASHVVELEPAPPMDARCGDEPGICLLGIPALVDEGGEALGWQCLGLNGGANAACALPAPVFPQSASPSATERTQPRPAPIAAQSVVAGPERQSAGGAQGGATRPAAVRQRTQTQIAELLAAKSRRSPAQRKVGSELLKRAAAEALRASGGVLPEDRQRLADTAADAEQAEDGRVLVDIRAEVTAEVLASIRELSGAVVNSVPRYRAIRALLPLSSVEQLAALDAIQTIRTADEARTRGQASTFPCAVGTGAADRAVTRKTNTTAGDAAHRASAARRTHGVDGTGIGIGVLSNGVGTLADRQASGDLPARVTVLPGQEGAGDEGTAMLRDGPTLTATTTSGQARVSLTWIAVDVTPWTPAPTVAYIVYRDDGSSLEAVAEDLAARSHNDTGVTVGTRYTYRVAAVVDGAEAARSAPVAITAGAANQPPVPAGTLADRSLSVGGDALEVDVAGAFVDPEGNTLTYGATSSATSVATVSRSGSTITITPVAAGRTVVTVTATDAGGSNMSATQRFTVRVGYDYDADEDGLIEIETLAQLYAMRYDPNGNGVVVYYNASAFAAAFPSAFDRLGCALDGCAGYELLADLDVDTNGNGRADAGDTYWNNGDGWEPIASSFYRLREFEINGFETTFDGNGHVLANLFVAREDHAGLFAGIGAPGVVRNVRLLDVDVTGKEGVGGLAGASYGLVSGVGSTGRVSGEVDVGGLVGAQSGNHRPRPQRRGGHGEGRAAARGAVDLDRRHSSRAGNRQAGGLQRRLGPCQPCERACHWGAHRRRVGRDQL